MTVKAWGAYAADKPLEPMAIERRALGRRLERRQERARLLAQLAFLQEVRAQRGRFELGLQPLGDDQKVNPVMARQRGAVDLVAVRHGDRNGHRRVPARALSPRGR